MASPCDCLSPTLDILSRVCLTGHSLVSPFSPSSGPIYHSSSALSCPASVSCFASQCALKMSTLSFPRSSLDCLKHPFLRGVCFLDTMRDCKSLSCFIFLSALFFSITFLAVYHICIKSIYLLIISPLQNIPPKGNTFACCCVWCFG